MWQPEAWPLPGLDCTSGGLSEGTGGSVKRNGKFSCCNGCGVSTWELSVSFPVLCTDSLNMLPDIHAVETWPGTDVFWQRQAGRFQALFLLLPFLSSLMLQDFWVGTKACSCQKTAKASPHSQSESHVLRPTEAPHPTPEAVPEVFRNSAVIYLWIFLVCEINKIVFLEHKWMR